MKRKCIFCLDELDDLETQWYSDNGILVEDDVICETCYLSLRKMNTGL